MTRLLPPWFDVCASWRYGVWWVRIHKITVFLRAPWDKPLFSERNGIRPTYKLGFGWRIQVRSW